MYRVIHNKSGKDYIVLNDMVINATNSCDGQAMIVYMDNSGQVFVRKEDEFKEKFTIPFDTNAPIKDVIINTEINQLLKSIKLPCHYDDDGQFIVDALGNILLEVRGNALLNKESTRMQDVFGELVAISLNVQIQSELSK